jgi:hypothetical protein
MAWVFISGKYYHLFCCFLRHHPAAPAASAGKSGQNDLFGRIQS